MPSRRRNSSVEGCCICGVTSSTEPFQSSNDISHNKNVSAEVFRHCFKLERERSGDLCSACLLIAKKWLKMSRTTRRKRNWGQVVDSKREVKPDSRREKMGSTSTNDVTTESTREDVNFGERKVNQQDLNENGNVSGEKSQNNSSVSMPEDGLSDDDNDSDNMEEMDALENCELDFAIAHPSPKDYKNNNNDELSKKEMVSTGTQTAFLFPALTSPQANADKLPFIDLSKWRQEDICCGTIFRGPNGEVLVDPKWLRSSCEMCNRSSQPPTPIEKNNSEAISVFDEKLASLCS